LQAKGKVRKSSDRKLLFAARPVLDATREKFMTDAAANCQNYRTPAQSKGESWEQFSERHGDWGRDAVLWLGRHAGRMRQAELAALVGGCDYTTAAKGVSRFGLRLAKDAKFAEDFQAIRNELSNF
jgi:hypothetical protein